MEIWKRIPNFSRYEASSEGRLRSTNYKNSGKTKVLKPCLSDGYYKTMLVSDSGKYKTWNVHKFIAITFLGESKLEVNHIDGNKENNSVSNLEYVTRSENMIHAMKNGLQKPKRGDLNGMSKLTREQALEIKAKIKERGLRYDRKGLAKEYGVSDHCIKDIAMGRTWNI